MPPAPFNALARRLSLGALAVCAAGCNAFWGASDYSFDVDSSGGSAQGGGGTGSSGGGVGGAGGGGVGAGGMGNGGAVGGGGDGGSSSSKLIIAEFFASGSKSNQSFERDYAVLKNVGDSPVDVTGWSFQHYKTTLGWKVLALTPTSIPANGTYLIRLYYDGGGESGMALPPSDLVAPNVNDWNLSTTVGESIAIVNTSTVLTTCTSATIVDLVGFNDSAPCSEGGTSAPTTTDVLAAARLNMRTQDTDENAVDFALATPNP